MSDQLFECAVRNWLEDGSDRAPNPAIDAVLLAVKTTPQERDLRIPRRFNLMPSYLRFAAVAAVIAIAGLGAVTALKPGSAGTGPTPPPTNQPTASPQRTMAADAPLPAGPVSTDGWVPFASERYGFTISRPQDWLEIPAEHDWRFPQDVDWQSTGAEAFVGAPLRVTAWAVAVEPGTTADAWIANYCPRSTGPCSALRDRAMNVSLDGHPGVLHRFGSDTQSFFLVEDRMYVVAAWRPGAEDYLEAFLSTVELLPAD